MRTIAEKVVLVAQICITLVFVLTTVLYLVGVIPYYNYGNIVDDNGTNIKTESGQVLNVLMFVLAIVYLGLSAYMLYVNFSERVNLRQIMLFCDSDSATRTNAKVLSNIVNGCAKQVEGIGVRRLKVRSDEKGGLVATICVRVWSENVSQSVNKLRCLVADSFKNTLGLTFNTINFQIERLDRKYRPNTEHAQDLAETLEENQRQTTENYEKPLGDDCQKSDGKTDSDADNAAKQSTDEQPESKNSEEGDRT